MSNLDYLHKSLLISTSSPESLEIMDLWDLWLRQQGYVSGTVLDRLQQLASTNNVTAADLLNADVEAVQAINAHRGPQLLLNGEFDTDTAWTKGSGWTISSGAGQSAGSTGGLSQAVAGLVEGDVYQVQWDIISGTSGQVRPRFSGGTIVDGTLQTAPGTYIENLVVAAGNTTFVMNSLAFLGSVDHIFLRRVNV